MTEISNIQLYSYQAECGDAFRIRYIGNDNKAHNIFVDSGYERTYRHILQTEIEAISKANEFIDLWVVSHIHDDHIGGIIKYIKAIKDEEISDIVKEWYYNPPRNYIPLKWQNPISSASSIDQGDFLFDYLYQMRKILPFDVVNELEELDFFGLKIEILSPSVENLQKLRDKYKKNIPLERSEYNDVSSAKSSSSNDYNIPLSSFNLDNIKEDKSEENGSSISILATYKDSKILFLADSHPSVITSCLKKKGYSNKKPLKCDYVIVSHHGSEGNNSSDLYSLIKCNNYIFSTNGEKHNLPNKSVFAQILKNPHRDIKEQYSIYFLYNTDILNDIFRIDGEEVYDKWDFKTHLSDNKMFILMK
ncbi:MBL fold metallo-hydrolase [Dysgonomonas sp. Marseille-P4677]|uniref:MBL fold metallo-hydrolase n=1 Tax=Dysgonomonas sp. Marseille-P4677 TaxID=2364790 RepID=UPI0019114276|nr:MBL fold metallo-hydrolase [Dysgonomonas sp. Marseille-P4677]MBK5722491.1 MBL fold metallo-hydrolase [Dysgonomonas sp. Marseille-P4677]